MNVQYNYRATGWLIFLAVLIMTILLAGTVLSGKMVNFGFFLQPGSTVVFPLVFLFSSVVAEIYGYNVAKQLIWIVIICGYVFAFLIEGVLLLPSPAEWDKDAAYQDIFGYLLRFSTAGTLGIIVGLFVDSYLIAKTKIIMHGRYFWLRALGAMSIGIIAHVTVTATLFFWGRMPIQELMQVIGSMCSFRIVCTAILLLPSQLMVNFLKNKEKINYYDYDINFNPFKFN